MAATNGRRPYRVCAWQQHRPTATYTATSDYTAAGRTRSLAAPNALPYKVDAALIVSAAAAAGTSSQLGAEALADARRVGAQLNSTLVLMAHGCLWLMANGCCCATGRNAAMHCVWYVVEFPAAK